MPVLRKIMVPTDFSMGSRQALSYALFLAEAHDASVDVIHIYDVPTYVTGGLVAVLDGDQDVAGLVHTRARKDLDQFLAALDLQLSRVTARLIEGDALKTILAEAKSYDLVVMGTHGREGLEQWLLGSIAEQVIRSAPCPVLVVRART